MKKKIKFSLLMLSATGIFHLLRYFRKKPKVFAKETNAPVPTSRELKEEALVEKEDRKLPGMRKIKRLKIFLFVLIGIGVLFMMYPLCTNFIASVKKTDVLSSWESEKEVAVEQEDLNADHTRDTEGEAESEAENNDALDYRNLAAEDFFPLKIIIPKIELEWIVNEGTDRKTLRKGPGHIPETRLPGDIGRCTISGHRTTYGAPFNRIDELESGDLIYLETIKGKMLTFYVTGQEDVYPEDVYILESSGRRELLLTACTPEYSAAKRLVIISELLDAYSLGIDFKK